ncbi:hypothetical protein D3C87_1601050 [compost metagenome]
MRVFLFSLLSLAMSVPAFADQYFYEEPNLQEEEVYEIPLDTELDVQDINYNFNFGNVRVSRSRSTVFYLRNTGRLPYIINDIDIDGGGNQFRESNNCPRILFRGARCSVRVTFRPNSTGQKRATLEIERTGAQDVNVRLRGRGVNY